jgi:hypothetical protein
MRSLDGGLVVCRAKAPGSGATLAHDVVKTLKHANAAGLLDGRGSIAVTKKNNQGKRTNSARNSQFYSEWRAILPPFGIKPRTRPSQGNEHRSSELLASWISACEPDPNFSPFLRRMLTPRDRLIVVSAECLSNQAPGSRLKADCGSHATPIYSVVSSQRAVPPWCGSSNPRCKISCADGARPGHDLVTYVTRQPVYYFPRDVLLPTQWSADQTIGDSQCVSLR